MISVIIPVFNSEKYLQRMVDSLLHQTYKDFEVIFIDDGSYDKSGEICNLISKDDNRFSVFRQTNSGAGQSRNEGLKRAKGAWVAFLDSDDQIPDNYFSVLVDEQNKSQADIVVCSIELCDEEGNYLSSYTCENKVVNSEESLNLLLTRQQINSGPCGKLIRKNLALSSEFPPLSVYEDILYMKNILAEARTVALTDKTKYIYYQHASSLMGNILNDSLRDVIEATDELVQFIKNRDDLEDECLYITFSHLYQYVLQLSKTEDSHSKEFIQKSRDLFRSNIISILNNDAFPWKEKIVFALFSVGIM